MPSQLRSGLYAIETNNEKQSNAKKKSNLEFFLKKKIYFFKYNKKNNIDKKISIKNI
jgi:hypothetical protein